MRHVRIGRLIPAVVAALALSGHLSATGVERDIDIDALNEARDLYQGNCAMCHGYDGVPILPGAPNFAAGDRLDAGDPVLLKTMRDGKGTMPAWKDVMDAAERQATLNYARVAAGDSLFQEHCSECHENAVPGLAEALLGDKGKPKDDIAPEEICTDVDIENIIEPEDIVRVVNFLGDVPALFSLTPQPRK